MSLAALVYAETMRQWLLSQIRDGSLEPAAAICTHDKLLPGDDFRNEREEFRELVESVITGMKLN